jgi:hypothetical protein
MRFVKIFVLKMRILHTQEIRFDQVAIRPGGSKMGA